MIRKLCISLIVLTLAACSQNSETTIEKNNIDSRVVYGSDDRVDLYQLLDPEWFDIAQSTVAIFDQKKITDSGSHFQITSTQYGNTYGLCEDEPFYEQPISAFCSGSLIGPDLIVTAGHCIRNEYNCEKARFVFNYSYKDKTSDPTIVAKNDVYSCKKIIHTETNALTGIDFALIRLDRKVHNHPILPIQLYDKINNQQNLVVIGHPSGLPAKFAGNASVRTNDEDHYFVSNLDTYGGNSGSPVFNADTKEIEGILVRGASDFLYDAEDKCRRSNVCADNSCRGEDVVRISSILNYITPADIEPLPLRPPATLLTPPIVY